MKKESKTQEQTNRLLGILGDNPHTRVRNFLITVSIIALVSAGRVVIYRNTIKKAQDRIQFCKNRTNTYLKKYFYRSVISPEIKSSYEKCTMELSSSFEADSKKYCEKLFHERFVSFRVGTSDKEAYHFIEPLKLCGNNIAYKFQKTKTNLEMQLSKYNETIDEIKNREDFKDNKAIQFELSEMKAAKSDFESRLFDLSKLESSL